MKDHSPASWLPRPSTRAWVREARRLPGYSWFDLLHGYVYARWPYLYIGIGTDEHWIGRHIKPVVVSLLAWGNPARLWRRLTGRVDPPPGPEAIGFADTYHGKVVTLQAATKLVTVNREISLTGLEHVIPYRLAQDIILRHPDHIVALDCPCRVARAEPCLPLDVCLIVGEPFASFVREHHRGRSRAIDAAEAVAILRAEHERGHVHHAFFKDAMLGRFYAICNCCACCCGAMQAQRNGVPMLAASGYRCQADSALCAGCGRCAEMCQFGAISVPEDRAVVDATACMGCGVCVDLCPQDALRLVRDEAKGVPLELDVLMGEAMGYAREAS